MRLIERSIADSLDFFNGKAAMLDEAGEFDVFGSNGKIGFSSGFNHERAIILGRVGAYCGSVMLSEDKFWATDNTIVLKAKNSQSLRYWFYRLANFPIRSFAGGAAQPLMTHGILKGINITFHADTGVQEKIADVLGTYDDLIENNRRRMALLEESARLLYREWFVRLRFPGHEHTRIVDGLPHGWERKTLESICLGRDGIQTGPFGSQLHQADYSEEGVPVVMPKDLISFRVSVASIARIPESLADSLGRHRMLPGDTVYGRRGDIGRRAYIGRRQSGWFCGTGCLRVRPDAAVINPLYLFDSLGTPETVGVITNRAKGSTMLNLSGAALKPVPVLVPPRTLQDLYVEQVAPMQEIVDNLDSTNQKLREARDLLLPRLMSGELKV